jgi:hypothetical protein
MIQIDHLDFKIKKLIYNTKTIHIIHNTITQLSLSINIYFPRSTEIYFNRMKLTLKIHGHVSPV